jgi:Lrp/AsnC family leucine-responsive transcriptional regulator
MEKSGLIQSYTVITDDSKLGNDITVLMEIGMEHPRYNDEFISQVNLDPNIIACYYLTGEFDFMLKICCRSSDHLEQIHNRIKDYPGVRLTRTHYVLRTVKNIHSSGFEVER